MRERNLMIVTILVILGSILIISWLVVGIFQASKESYCNSLELQEYLEQRDYCKEYIEKWMKEINAKKNLKN